MIKLYVQLIHYFSLGPFLIIPFLIFTFSHRRPFLSFFPPVFFSFLVTITLCFSFPDTFFLSASLAPLPFCLPDPLPSTFQGMFLLRQIVVSNCSALDGSSFISAVLLRLALLLHRFCLCSCSSAQS